MKIETLWLYYTAVATPVFAGLFFWALRCGQFRFQDRARHLALPDPPSGSVDSDAFAEDGRLPLAALAPLIVLAIVLVFMGVAVYVGASHPAAAGGGRG